MSDPIFQETPMSENNLAQTAGYKLRRRPPKPRTLLMKRRIQCATSPIILAMPWIFSGRHR